MYRCVPQKRLDQRIGHLGIGDMKLVHRDVGPDVMFQRERVQSVERGGAALSLSFAATLWRIAEERGTKRGVWEEMAREAEEKQSGMPQKPTLVLLERANIR